MTVTAEQVFTIAMNIMDEVTQDGTFTGYPTEYKGKAWPILTTLQAELLPAAIIPTTIETQNSTFLIDDRTALTALPYGLAAHFLLTEDPVRAGFFNNRYDELKRKRPAKAVKITDVYGVSEATEEDTTTETPSDTSFDGDTDTFDGGEF